MIEVQGGRSKSHRTKAELEEMLKREMASLTPEEREAMEIIIQELSQPQTGPTLLDTLTKVEYKRTPVSMETFVRDPYYLGNTCDNIYPQLMRDLEDLFSGGYHEAIWTGCIDLNAIIQGSNGSLKTIREWIGTRGEVLGFDSSGTRSAPTGRAKHSGVCPTLRLVLANGMEERLTPNHEVVVWREEYRWLPASEVELDDFVVVPRRIRTAPDSKLSEVEAKLLAYWCTDGSSSEQRSRFDDGNPATSLEVVELLHALGFSGKRTQIENYWEVYVEEHKRSGFLDWLRQHEGYHQTKDVLVPDVVCRASDSVVATFLNRVWAAEGCVYVNPAVSPPRFALGMTSERFVRQVQMLLLRFDVQSRVAFTPQFDKRSGKTTDTWLLTVSGCGPMKRFLETVGPILGKESKCVELAEYMASRNANTNVDVLPIERRWLSKRMTEEGLTRAANSRWWELARGTGRYLSRQMFDAWKAEFGSTEFGQRLTKQFPDDFGFERVKEISDGGEIEVGDVCDVENVHSFISNGIYSHNSIGYGKTHVATIGVCRVLYELSCMQDPHKSYGLAHGSNLSIICTSVNETLAIKVVFEAIASKIKASPYFEENFPFEDTKKEMRFPGGIWVAARASTDTSALGLNAIGALMDEQNFLAPRTAKESQMGVLDRAETIYNTIQRRMKSRFERHGKLPGMLFIVSSKKTMDDFTAKRIRESKNDPTVFVRDYALWDTKPEDQYSAKRFWVLCGNDTVPSKVLTDAEYVEIKDKIPENATLVHVPEDFRRDFERDLEGSIRDLAGVATVAINPFIHRREKILEAIDTTRSHPFSSVVYDPSKKEHFFWGQMVRETVERGYLSSPDESARMLRPILNPKVPRHIHIDPSLRGDATGFAMAHIGGWKDVVRRADDGKEYMERAPIYVVDLMLRIVPPTGGEIVLADLRHIVYDLAAHGYMITGVTLDSWQSADTIQQLNQRGFNSQILSVDTSTDPYESLKTALYENRVSYYEYMPLIEELQQLERHFNGKKTKIDHPAKGRKDVADALAACLFSLSTKGVTQPLPFMKGLSYSGDAWLEEQQQSVLAGNKKSAMNTTLLPAFLTGGSSDSGGGWNDGGEGGNGGGGWYPG